jgi:diguanylate cyclase (GGDEF)-like protein
MGESAVLFPVVQMLVLARELDDVRQAIGHGARILTRYESVTLFEHEADGGLAATLRAGAALGPFATGLEARLAEKAVKTATTVSTLDRVGDARDQAELDEYTDGGRLLLARPLRAYGESVGALVLHVSDRAVLDDGEFDGLRRFCEFAAAALSNARVRAELDGYAYTDHLTGLANRRRLESEFTRLAGSRLALLLVDFDGLKAVNDTLTYDDGDQLIAAVGGALSALARPGELVARYGGDEFVVMIEGVASTHARERADEITSVLDRLKLPPAIAALFRGASVGWAIVEPHESAAVALTRAAVEMRSRKRRRKTDRELNGDEITSRPLEA